MGLAADGRIVRLRSTSIPGGPAETASASFLGAHRIGASLVDQAPAQGCLIADLYIPALLRGERLVARPTSVRWIDVGSPAGLPRREPRLAGSAATPSSARAPTIDPAVTVRASVIGRGARVVGEGLLERVVVWPGAVAHAPLSDAVVTLTQVVRR